MNDTPITMETVNELNAKTINGLADTLQTLAAKLKTGELSRAQVGRHLRTIGNLMVEMGLGIAGPTS